MVSKLKRTPTEWEKIFANCTSDSGVNLKKLDGFTELLPPSLWAWEDCTRLISDFSKSIIPKVL
jgi:hypothetical protein